MPSKWCSASQTTSAPSRSASFASRTASSMTTPSFAGSRLSEKRKVLSFTIGLTAISLPSAFDGGGSVKPGAACALHILRDAAWRCLEEFSRRPKLLYCRPTSGAAPTDPRPSPRPQLQGNRDDRPALLADPQRQEGYHPA